MLFVTSEFFLFFWLFALYIKTLDISDVIYLHPSSHGDISETFFWSQLYVQPLVRFDLHHLDLKYIFKYESLS